MRLCKYDLKRGGPLAIKTIGNGRLAINRNYCQSSLLPIVLNPFGTIGNPYILIRNVIMSDSALTQQRNNVTSSNFTQTLIS